MTILWLSSRLSQVKQLQEFISGFHVKDKKKTIDRESCEKNQKLISSAKKKTLYSKQSYKWYFGSFFAKPSKVHLEANSIFSVLEKPLEDFQVPTSQQRWRKYTLFSTWRGKMCSDWTAFILLSDRFVNGSCRSSIINAKPHKQMQFETARQTQK